LSSITLGRANVVSAEITGQMFSNLAIDSEIETLVSGADHALEEFGQINFKNLGCPTKPSHQPRYPLGLESNNNPS
jgi:hypothetical protein